VRATYVKESAGAATQAVPTPIGVIASPAGLVMFSGAAASLVTTVSNVVITVGGRDLPGRYLGQAKGVALARIVPPEKGATFPFLQFSEQRAVKVGEVVFAVGSLGSAYGHARTATVSRIAAVLDTPSDLYLFGRRDAQQGAPVLTADGAVIGVIGIDEEYYKIAMRHPQRQKALQALLLNPTVLPSSVVAPLIKNPPRSGAQDYAKRGWIGAAVEVMAQEIARELGIKEQHGVYVSYVVPGSQMARSGLKQGDVIVQWGESPAKGQNAAELLEFRKRVNETKPGTEVEVQVFRAGKRLTLKTAVEKTPPGFAEAPGTQIRELGIVVKPLTHDVRLSYRIGWRERGVIVSYAAPGAAAGLAGVRPLDVIKQMNGKPVKSPAEFRKAVRAAAKAKGREVVLLVAKKRNTQTVLVRVRLGK
jgi:serine protease Do